MYKHELVALKMLVNITLWGEREWKKKMEEKSEQIIKTKMHDVRVKCFASPKSIINMWSFVVVSPVNSDFQPKLFFFPLTKFWQ